MGISLYDLVEGYRNILEIAETMEEQDLIDVLKTIEDDIDIKGENYAKIIKNLTGSEDMLNAEIKRLTARKNAIKTNITRLKTTLQEGMEAVGKDKIKGQLFTVAIQNNPPSVDIADESIIPRRLFVKQLPVLDKNQLLSELKQGKKIKGADIKQTRSIRIR